MLKHGVLLERSPSPVLRLRRLTSLRRDETLRGCSPAPAVFDQRRAKAVSTHYRAISSCCHQLVNSVSRSPRDLPTRGEPTGNGSYVRPPPSGFMVNALAPSEPTPKVGIVVGIRTRLLPDLLSGACHSRRHLQSPCSERTVQIHQDGRCAAGSNDIDTSLIRDVGGSRTHLSCLLQAAAVPSGDTGFEPARKPIWPCLSGKTLEVLKGSRKSNVDPVRRLVMISQIVLGDFSRSTRRISDLVLVICW